MDFITENGGKIHFFHSEKSDTCQLMRSVWIIVEESRRAGDNGRRGAEFHRRAAERR